MKKSSGVSSPRSNRMAIFLIAVGALVALQLLGTVLMLYAPPYYVRMIMLSGIAIVLAVSLNLVNGFAGQFSLGHAGFYAIGAYASGVLTFYWGNGLVAWLTGFAHLPLALAAVLLMLLAILIAAVAAGTAGYLVGLPSLRLRGDYLAIATLGFGEAIRVIIENSDAVGGARGFDITRDATGTLLNALGAIDKATFTWIFGAAILVVLFSRNLAMSSHGRALFAIRDDEVAAESAGVAVFRYKVMVFAMGAAWAGVAGALFAQYDDYLTAKSFDFMKSIDIVVMVVLGGGGSITGSCVAAIVLTALPMLLQNYLPGSIQNVRMVVYAVLLIVLMLTRPQGLFGRSEFSVRNLFRRRSVQPPRPANPDGGNSGGGGK
ncbi:MAG: branched-chain amino acid ABC transporter permease [Armatimonadota bacterium]|nr:branched-chain amino acid ABC transporter permease [Armatimonadota bacterium]